MEKGREQFQHPIDKYYHITIDEKVHSLKAKRYLKGSKAN